MSWRPKILRFGLEAGEREGREGKHRLALFALGALGWTQQPSQQGLWGQEDSSEESGQVAALLLSTTAAITVPGFAEGDFIFSPFLRGLLGVIFYLLGFLKQIQVFFSSFTSTST